MIRVSIEVQDQLKAMRKKDERLEAIGDVVKRLILDNRKLLAENNAYAKQAQHPIQVIGEPMPSPEMPVPPYLHGVTSLMPSQEKPI